MRIDRFFGRSLTTALRAMCAVALITVAPLTFAAPHSVNETSADHETNTAEQTTPNDRTPPVIVRAHRTVRHQIAGRDYAGVPIEQIQLTREVSYSALNLKTAKGADELRTRINDTAREACQQLSSLYPLALWTTSNQTCIDQAEKMAMAQLSASGGQLGGERTGTTEASLTELQRDDAMIRQSTAEFNQSTAEFNQARSELTRATKELQATTQEEQKIRRDEAAIHEAEQRLAAVPTQGASPR